MSGMIRWVVWPLTGATIILGALLYFCILGSCSWVFVPGLSPFFTYQWESKGPFKKSGAIRHILIDPLDSRRLYAAAENGGLWVLDDHNQPDDGWRPLSDNLDNLQMRGIAKSSVSPDYIVTANAAGFVYHSKDHGTTWSKVTSENFQYIRRILIAENGAETRIWVAGQRGLFLIRLINGNLDRVDQLYPQTAVQLPDVLDAVRNPMSGDIYIGVRGQGAWKRAAVPANPADAWTLSADWAPLGDLGSPMIKLAITPGGDRLVAKFGRKVIVNDADGDPAQWISASAVPFADTGGNDIGYRGNYSGSRGEWTHAIAISPADKNHIAVGQADLFISTTGGQPGPGGAPAWTKVEHPGHEDMQSLAFSPDGNWLFIANDGGVFRYPVPVPTTIADNPEDLNDKLTTFQFYRVALNGSVAVGNGDHQGILGTENIEAPQVVWRAGVPHRNLTGFGGTGLEDDFVSADPKTPGRFFVQFFHEHLLRLKFPLTSPPSGEDLLPINPTMTPLRPFHIRKASGTSAADVASRTKYNQLNYPVGTVAVDPRPETNILLVAVHFLLDASFGIQKTANANVDPTGGPKIPCTVPPDPPPGGCYTTPVENTATWTPVFGPVATPIVSITFSPSEPGKAYALDEAGRVFVLGNVDDPAAMFQPAGNFAVSSAANQQDFARQIIADPTTPGRLFALSHRQIQLSTDGNAAIWNPIHQTTLPAAPAQFNALCLHPTNSNILYLATASGVLVSEDGGAHWRSIHSSLPNVPVMQVFTNATHLYAVTFGRGLWRAKLP